MSTKLDDAQTGFANTFEQAPGYADFLSRYGNQQDQNRWQSVYDSVVLNETQCKVLKSFKREMHILCMAGAWCGDCVSQCPILQRFAEQNDCIQLRFFDRDAMPEIAGNLKICGASRVPQVVFMSEDNLFVGRFGDRTLTRYRQMSAEFTGEACATGLVSSEDPTFLSIIQDWLNEFERIQLILRTSPSLRKKHND